MVHEIKFYRTKDGKCPAEEFLDSLTGKEAQKVTWILKFIEENKNIPVKFFKKLSGTDDIWEVRVNFQSKAIRLFAFFKTGTLIILTHGLIKKTQKTPSADIEKAKKFKKDYFLRYPS